MKVVLSGFNVRLLCFVQAKLNVSISWLHLCLCMCRCDGDVIYNNNNIYLKSNIQCI